MADLTKAQFRDRVLEHMGILAAGQSASAEDAEIVEEAIDSAHDQLRKFGLAPFATSAIPAWAQPGLRSYVCDLVGPTFGFGGAFAGGRDAGRKELADQVAITAPPIAIEADYF